MKVPCKLAEKPATAAQLITATCHVGRPSTGLGIAGSAGRAPPIRAGGLAENRLL